MGTEQKFFFVGSTALFSLFGRVRLTEREKDGILTLNKNAEEFRMKHKISICIDELQAKYGDRRALELAGEMGVDAVDFSLLYYDDTLYKKSEVEITAEMHALRDYAKELGIEIGQTHGRIIGFRNDPSHDAEVVRLAGLDCLATAALDAPYCVMHTVSTIFMGADADPKLMHQLNFDMFTAILPYAKRYGIKVATETFGDAPGTGVCDFFGNLKEMLIGFNRISAAVGDLADSFCLCMDTGHTNKATRFAGNPTPGDAIRMLGNRIEVLHLNDNDTLTDQHKAPMTGTVDWDDVLSALEEIGYRGNYNLELYLAHFGKDFEYETAEFGVKVLRKMLRDRYGDEA